MYDLVLSRLQTSLLVHATSVAQSYVDGMYDLVLSRLQTSLLVHATSVAQSIQMPALMHKESLRPSK
jgi:hypothetical protein